MKQNLDTGVEVCDDRVKKNQHHTTNEKPNMYIGYNKLKPRFRSVVQIFIRVYTLCFLYFAMGNISAKYLNPCYVNMGS